MYYEEPVHPLNAVSMREIKENIRIPVASGERDLHPSGLPPLLREPLPQRDPAGRVPLRWYFRGQEDLRHGGYL